MRWDSSNLRRDQCCHLANKTDLIPSAIYMYRLKNFWIQLVIRIATKTSSLIPWATPHPLKIHQHPFHNFISNPADKQTEPKA